MIILKAVKTCGIVTSFKHSKIPTHLGILQNFLLNLKVGKGIRDVNPPPLISEK
jgi:hypothetical protein